MERMGLAHQFGSRFVDQLTQPRPYKAIVKAVVDDRCALDQGEFAIIITGCRDLAVDVGDTPRLETYRVGRV